MAQTSSAAEITERVWQATQLVDTSADLTPHVDWVIGELLQIVGPGDLEPSEKMGIAVILAGAHARKRSTFPGRRDLLAMVERLAPAGSTGVQLRLISS